MKEKVLNELTFLASFKNKIVNKDNTVLDEIKPLSETNYEKNIVLDLINQLVVTVSNTRDIEMSILAIEAVKRLQIEEEIPYCVLFQITNISYEEDANKKRAFIEEQIALDTSTLTEAQKSKYIYMYNRLALVTIYSDLNDLTEQILEKIRSI